MKLTEPHGGVLVNREVTGSERDQLMRAASEMPRLQLDARQISDLLMIATGAYSPIEGFMGLADYRSVCSNMRLASGVVWPIPITLSVSSDDAKRLKVKKDVALYQDHLLVGVLHLQEKYSYGKMHQADLVYRTTDQLHPGVQALYNQGDWLLGGRISLINRPDDVSFREYIFDEFEPHELGITPLFFDHTFFCKSCGAMASTKTCPHEQTQHVTLSGTRVRELLNAGQLPPIEFSRPEVAQVLIEAYAAARTMARII